MIKEVAENEMDLLSFRQSVNDSKTALIMAIIWASYFVIIASTTLFLYKKNNKSENKKSFKDGGIILVLLAVIGISLLLKASLDLNHSLQDVNFYYYTIIQ